MTTLSRERMFLALSSSKSTPAPFWHTRISRSEANFTSTYSGRKGALE